MAVLCIFDLLVILDIDIGPVRSKIIHMGRVLTLPMTRTQSAIAARGAQTFFGGPGRAFHKISNKLNMQLALKCTFGNLDTV